MEPQLDELRGRFYEYQQTRHESLLERFDGEARQRVYIRHEQRGIEPHVDFLFSDKSALDRVRFRHFYKDCRAIAGARDELAPVIDQERKAAVAFLNGQFENILRNFDPTVVPLRKKRKIIFADGALDDLP